MKTTRVFYWRTTGLLSLLMVFSSISSLASPAQAAAFFKGMGMPTYLIPFLSIAKLLGVVAILVPGFPRLREWAYAGLTFDLIGALVCNYYSASTPAAWTPMFLFIALALVSYFLYHRLRDQKAR